MKWPNSRSFHASSIIYTVSSNQQVTSHMIMLGGLDNDLQPLNDCWILNISSLIWYQVMYITSHVCYCIVILISLIMKYINNENIDVLQI